MKGRFQKTFSLIMCIIMVFAMFQGSVISASAKLVGPDNKVQLKIKADKFRYSWGDMIVFNINVKNVTNDDLNNVEIISFSRDYLNLVWQGDVPVIDTLEPGETETVQVKYAASKTLSVVALLMSFLRMFHPEVRAAYRKANFNYEKTVRVGGAGYKVGFEVEYDQSVSFDIPDYKPGDYTAALNDFFTNNSYTFSAILNSNETEVLKMTDANVVLYVDGDRKATQFTAEVGNLLNAIKADIPLVDQVLARKTVNNLQVNAVVNGDKFYAALPQIGTYIKIPTTDATELIFELTNIVLYNTELIGTETVNGMVKESFMTKGDLIAHYYYKDGRFVKLDVEDINNSMVSNLITVKALIKEVKNKAVLTVPYGLRLS